jgi:hypothetical protein
MMTCKTYIGTPHRESVTGQPVVTVCDGQKCQPLPFRLDLFNHSPTGFSWGYGGSGPAQLALALLADALADDDRAVRLHQEFKFKVVACWPEGERWWITAEQITAVVNLIEQENVQAAKKNDQVQGSEAAAASTTAAFDSLSRIRSLADYTIITREFEFSEATGRGEMYLAPATPTREGAPVRG